jgi:hypothetical protein
MFRASRATLQTPCSFEKKEKKKKEENKKVRDSHSKTEQGSSLLSFSFSNLYSHFPKYKHAHFPPSQIEHPTTCPAPGIWISQGFVFSSRFLLSSSTPPGMRNQSQTLKPNSLTILTSLRFQANSNSAHFQPFTLSLLSFLSFSIHNNQKLVYLRNSLFRFSVLS